MEKRGQISFEYMVLFSVTLIVFVTIGTFVALGIEKVNSSQEDAKMLSERIKVEAITASLSPMDYESSFLLPKRMGKFEYEVQVYGSDDLLLIIREDGKQIARSYLPKLGSEDTDPVKISSGASIKIFKQDGRLFVEEGDES